VAHRHSIGAQLIGSSAGHGTLTGSKLWILLPLLPTSISRRRRDQAGRRW